MLPSIPSSSLMPTNPSMTLMLLTLSHLALNRQSQHNRFVQKSSSSPSSSSSSSSLPLNESYFDYIIVGGGTTGCILANRLLTKIPNVTILLLEAGGPQSIITDMIGNTQYLIGGEFDWNYHVERQRWAGQAYPEFSITRGKVLGGTSTTQWGIYSRGNPLDYDNWSQKYDLPNMSWSNVLRYFLKFENNTGLLDSTYHSNRGPVTISTESKPDPILLKFLQLMNQLGFQTIDVNGPTQLGTTIAQMFYNSENGLKSTTANSYLESSSSSEQILNNNRLQIISRAMVRKILFQQQNQTYASGVIFHHRNDSESEYRIAYARREIILAAGPINTPQLLMLSGIGPEKHLQELNIPIIRNLPVGENLQDMIFVPLYYLIKNSSLINPYPRFDTKNLYDYFYNHNGPLAHHADGLTYFISSNQNQDQQQWPDTMIITVVEFFNDLNGTVMQYINNTDQWYQYWQPFSPEGYYLAVDPVLARPKSRGTVRLNPQNIYGPPLIDPKYLSETEDFEALLDVTRFVVDAIRKNPIQDLEMFPAIPGCPIPCITETLCESYLRCHIRLLARSYYNFAGTTRMGLAGQPETVVDQNFKVLGFDNLRVIDASIVPELPNGHITAATMMLGEMGAEMVINDYNNNHE